jgi:fumarylpyruvate hydrolase
MSYLFSPRPQPALPVIGETGLYPVARIFCVGRNYAAHAAEMGGTVDREAPWYFTKSCHALAHSGATLPYPPGTADYHHEIELVLALGAEVHAADAQTARAAIYGYGVGLDMTRRDLQGVAKDNRRPWCLGKDVEGGAVMTALQRAFTPGAQRIHLAVNGSARQEGLLSDMVWSPAEIVAHLSRFYHLAPGDVIMTGTPAGVGAVVAGDVITGGIEGLPDIALTLA